MSTRPSAPEPPTTHSSRSGTNSDSDLLAGELLQQVSSQLHRFHRTVDLVATRPNPCGPATPALIVVHDELSASLSTPRIECRPLVEPDPIESLIGVRADPSWVMVGVTAGAVARPQRDGAETSPCGLVHLLHRSGVSMTTIERIGSEPIRLGPDAAIREGRIPDTCRRIFSLDTAAAPADMTAFVLDAWLSLVLRSALMRPGLRWPEIEQLSLVHHLAGLPVPHATTTPAALADLTRAAAGTLDWNRYRTACVALGGCPVSDLQPDAIEWMDAGMFARWSSASLPDTSELLDLLEPVLDPTAFDRLWATISLCHPGRTPEPRADR